MLQKSKSSKKPQMRSQREQSVQKSLPPMWVSLRKRFYKFCYLLGVFVIRNGQKIGRVITQKSKLLVARAEVFYLQQLVAPARRLWEQFVNLVYEFTDPFSHAVSETLKAWQQRKQKALSKEQKKACVAGYGKVLASLLNHLLPIAAALVLMFVVGRSMGMDYAIEVTYQDQVLGFVTDELTFQKAKAMMLERTVFESAISTEAEEADAPAETPATQTGSVATFGVDSKPIASFGTGLGATPLASDQTTAASGADKTTQTTTPDLSQAQQVTGKVQAKFRLVVVDAVSMDDADSLCDKLIRSLGDKIIEATGLYVNDVFYGSVEDGTALDLALQKKLEEADTGTGTVSFYHKVALKEGLYPTDTLVSQEQMQTLIDSQVAGKKTYTIQAGDAPYSIASKFDLPYSQFVSMNPNIETTCLVGQEVIISKEQAFLPILITKQITYNKDVPFDTVTKKSATYYTGYSAVSRNGVNGTDKVTATVSYLDGQEVSREVIKTVRVKEPVDKVVIQGSKPRPVTTPYQGGSSQGAVNPGGWAWPTRSHGISCGWWGYWGHYGIDIGGAPGTPIYASKAGRVTYAGWRNGGFGYYVQIDHGNGFVTGYMHNSFVSVRVGQHVVQGQQIAGMGATGNAFGSHCHFEMYYNGRYVNPTNYLPR